MEIRKYITKMQIKFVLHKLKKETPRIVFAIFFGISIGTAAYAWLKPSNIYVQIDPNDIEKFCQEIPLNN